MANKMVDRVTQVGKLLTAARKKKNWNHSDVAAQLNVTRAQVNNLELGNSLPASHYLHQLCKILDIKPAVMLKAIHDDTYED